MRVRASKVDVWTRAAIFAVWVWQPQTSILRSTESRGIQGKRGKRGRRCNLEDCAEVVDDDGIQVEPMFPRAALTNQEWRIWDASVLILNPPGRPRLEPA